MAKVIYATLTSLDGYVADQAGNFDWAAPNEEAHAFINDLERPIGTYLYGRKMYETMAGCETAETIPSHAIRAGLVDEYHVFVAPSIVGGGNPYLPDNVCVKLELLDQRGFDKHQQLRRAPLILALRQATGNRHAGKS